MSSGRNDWPWRDDEAPMQDQEWRRVGRGFALAVTVGCLVWVAVGYVLWRLLAWL